MVDLVATKQCSKCKKVLTVDKFHKDNHLKSGLRSQCIDCQRDYAQKPEVKRRANESTKRYNRKPGIKAKIKARMQRYRQRPEVKKHRAIKASKRYHDPSVKPRILKQLIEYRHRPEVKKHRKEYLEEYHKRPEIIAKVREYARRPDIKARNNAQIRKNYKKPEVKLRFQKQKAKRREIGYIEIWQSPFPDDIDVEYHHFIQGLPFVIPMPKITHNFVGGNASNGAHWTHNKDWINELYQLDIESLIHDEGGCVASC